MYFHCGMLLNIYILISLPVLLSEIFCVSFCGYYQVPYTTDAKRPSSDILSVKYLFYPNTQNAHRRDK